MSGKVPTEICAVWKRPDGTEEVHTGIFVFDTVTIRQIRELMGLYADSGREPPYKVEI